MLLFPDFPNFKWRASSLQFIISEDQYRVVSAQSVLKIVHFSLHLLQGVAEIGVAQNTVDCHDFVVRDR